MGSAFRAHNVSFQLRGTDKAADCILMPAGGRPQEAVVELRNVLAAHKEPLIGPSNDINKLGRVRKHSEPHKAKIRRLVKHTRGQKLAKHTRQALLHHIAATPVQDDPALTGALLRNPKDFGGGGHTTDRGRGAGRQELQHPEVEEAPGKSSPVEDPPTGARGLLRQFAARPIKDGISAVHSPQHWVDARVI
jgi:hypothetical protein